MARAMLRTRQIIPPLTLHALNGKTICAWDFKQKKNLIIAFLHAGCVPCDDFLRQLAAESVVWKEGEAVVLAALLESPPRALADSLPDTLIVGVDASGRAANAYLGRDTLSPAGVARLGVFITDRYGELFAQWQVDATHDFPDIAAIRLWLERVEMACDECSVPLWERED